MAEATKKNLDEVMNKFLNTDDYEILVEFLYALGEIAEVDTNVFIVQLDRIRLLTASRRLVMELFRCSDCPHYGKQCCHSAGRIFDKLDMHRISNGMFPDSCPLPPYKGGKKSEQNSNNPG